MHAILYYIRHWLTGLNAHSLQAPFIYNFYTKTLKSKRFNEDYVAIEHLRDSLQHSKEFIEVTAYGASSKVNNKVSRPISAIAKNGITPAKVSQMLAAIVHDYKSQHILELGTSFGLNTMYLALNKSASVTSFEGCSNTIALAKKHFRDLDFENIEVIEGNIDEMLPIYLNGIESKIDLVYFDANHRYLPTLNYFNLCYKNAHTDSIFVFDDIHWSSEMTRVWHEIERDERVTLSIDLFTTGIVFFKSDFSKSSYRLRI